MISWKEILGKYKESDIPEEHLENLKILHIKLNEVRTEYGNPMSPTSIYRTMADHLRIYKEMGITDKAKIPMKSKHLKGAACDIADPTGELYTWVTSNESILTKAGLWCEKGTVGWVHFQIEPYGSYAPHKSRLFNP